ncbi:MAG: BTAD domain-containing putative transcriptional regulator [Candidatus Eisenbacteria bacterium]
MPRAVIPIIPAKLTTPPVPASCVPRPRLDRLREGWTGRRLVLVTAGAGFGKTTFLAEHARASARPVVWYTPDEMDAGVAAFGAHLCHGLGCGGRGREASVDGRDPDQLLARLARALREAESDVTLVIDDFHLVAGAPGIDRFVEWLARYFPPGGTLILSSREAPTISTMKLRSLGQVAEVGASDLRFTEEETAALFRRRFDGAEIDLELCRRVTARTEGWAAGLAIFFQVLDSPAPHRVEEALSSMSAAGSGWFSYFTEEVLRRLDDETREFLLGTSLLPRLEPALCDRVLGIDGSGKVLERLASRNLFTFRSEGGGNAYRYHHLFREFLRDRLERSWDGAAIGRRLKLAATALEENGAFAEAVVAWAEAGRNDQALRLVEKLGEDLLAAGRFEVIRRALERMPPGLLDEHPAALLVLGRATEIPGRGEEAEKIYRRALRRADAGPLRIELMALIAQNLQRRGEHRKCTTLCQKALGEPRPIPARTRGRLLNMLGISACELGRLDEAEAYLEEATLLLRRSGERDIPTFYLLPGNIHYRRGDFQRAKEAARRALLEFKKRKDRRRFCHSLGVLAHVTAEACEVREARALAGEVLRLAEALDYPLMQGYGHMALGRCLRVEGDLRGARECFEAAQGIGERVGETGLRTIPANRLADIALREGNRPRAARLAGLALEEAVAAGEIYEEVESCLLLGDLRARTRPAEGERWRARAEKIIRRVGMNFELHRLLLGRLDSGRLSDDEARAALEELLTGAAALGHDFLFLSLEQERSIPVLARAVREGVEPEYASRLLGAIGEPAVPSLTPLATHADEETRTRTIHLLTRIGGNEAWRVLARAAEGGSSDAREARAAMEEIGATPRSPLRIYALGPLRVEGGGRCLELGDWKSARALRLFQLLLVHRFRWVPRDQLIETLWPDGDPAKGTNNFRQTIHLLRRVLRSGGEDAKSSPYILVHNESCRLEAGEGARYDVAEFEETIRLAEESRRSSVPEEANRLLRRAIEIYRGPFLAESPYEEFAADDRERLRDLFLRGLERLVSTLFEETRWEEAAAYARRGLAEDPYEEEFHFHLAAAHERLGHKQEALAAYHRYEEMMIRELDLLPSERMKKLADRIVRLGG